MTVVSAMPLCAADKAGEDWWSLQPIKRPTVPRMQDASWVQNAIDAFVLAKLQSNKLKPSPEANRRTLIRRLSYDLTGLPPSPAEVRAFLNDKAPNAYERVVARLLASPHTASVGRGIGWMWCITARATALSTINRATTRGRTATG